MHVVHNDPYRTMQKEFYLQILFKSRKYKSIRIHILHQCISLLNDSLLQQSQAASLVARVRPRTSDAADAFLNYGHYGYDM